MTAVSRFKKKNCPKHFKSGTDNAFQYDRTDLLEKKAGILTLLSTAESNEVLI
jgi:hypothetical protein